MTHNRLHAESIAEYFLANVDEASGDNITHLKLQKLLYYAQGLFLAHQGEPLFVEPIEAWELGPVVPSVYGIYRAYGNQPIAPGPPDRDFLFAPEVLEVLNSVQRVYGQFAAWKLSELTHEEPPWRETPRNDEIRLDRLHDFFRQVVEAGRTGDSVHGEPVWPTNTFRHQRRREIMRLAPDRDRLRAVLDHVASPDPWACDDN